MRKNFLVVAVIIAGVLYSCNNINSNNNSNEDAKTEQASEVDSNAVKTSLTDSLGNVLEMSLNNATDIMTISYKGETSELKSQKPASGMWYKNETYELLGKGNDVQLQKNGELVFEHKDNIVPIKAKNEKGDVLILSFNNTTGTVKAYLNGGEQIDLVQEKSASGIWYKNENYELTGKGDSYQLEKDGKVIFQN